MLFRSVGAQERRLGREVSRKKGREGDRQGIDQDVGCVQSIAQAQVQGRHEDVASVGGYVPNLVAEADEKVVNVCVALRLNVCTDQVEPDILATHARKTLLVDQEVRGSLHDDLAIKRIDYDLDYIEKWSFQMDVELLLRTVRREFLSGSGS